MEIKSIKTLFLRINKQVHIFKKLGPLFWVNLEYLLISFITNICFILKDWNACCTPLLTSAQKQCFSNLTLYGNPEKLDVFHLVCLLLYYFILRESMHSKKALLFLVTILQVTLRWHVLCLQVYLCFFSYVLSGNDVLFQCFLSNLFLQYLCPTGRLSIEQEIFAPKKQKQLFQKFVM